MAATVCALGQRRLAELFFYIFYKMDSTFGFELNFIVVEVIRGRCASFTGLTATVSEIFGGQTTPSILIVIDMAASVRHYKEQNAKR